MALRNIIADLASEAGIRTEVANSKARLVSLINDAAKILFETNDLKNSYWEQVFQCGITDQQITLPWYVDGIRAIRDYDSQVPIETIDMAPRYMTNGWMEVVGYKWRIKKFRQPLKKNIANVGPFTLTLSAASTEAFTLWLTAKTASAYKIKESIQFAVGDTAKTSTIHPEEVYDIEKSVLTSQDMVITDASANELSDIPNCCYKAEFTLIQVLDKYQTLGQTKLVEILYKTRYVPMMDDYDNFICGDLYDKVIYFKTLALFYSRNTDEIALAKMQANEVAANTLMKQIGLNREQSIKMKIDFGQNRFRNLTGYSGGLFTARPYYGN